MADLVERREWLIRKNGYFYRPNRAGYTSVKAEAGRYTEAEARREAAIEPDNMTALHQDEVPSPINYDTAEIEALRTALFQEREAREKAEAGHAAARQNFHTMQLAADALRKRAEAVEASLAEARRVLGLAQASMGGEPCGNCHRIAMGEIRRFLAQEPSDER